MDLQNEEILTHSRPLGGAYAETVRVGCGGPLASWTVPDLAVTAADVLGLAMACVVPMLNL